MWEEIAMFPSERLGGRQIFLKSEICSFKITLFRQASLQNFTSHIHFLAQYCWLSSISGRNEELTWRAVGTKRFAASHSLLSVSHLVTRSFICQGAKSVSRWSSLHGGELQKHWLCCPPGSQCAGPEQKGRLTRSLPATLSFTEGVGQTGLGYATVRWPELSVYWLQKFLSSSL